MIGSINYISFCFSSLFYSTRIIYKAYLDGSGVTPIVATGWTTIYGLAIDFSTDRVCWADYCKYHLINLCLV